ncbi:MAG: hypothetical protein AAGC60_30630 [Acidobacteriota bacterium]
MPLTAPIQREHRLGDLTLDPYPVRAGAVLYGGALAAIADATGLAEPAADAAGLRVVGLVYRGTDNSAGPDGALQHLDSRGVAELAIGPVIAWSIPFTGPAPARSAALYVVDDGLVTADAAATTHAVPAGVSAGLNPGRTNEVFVRIPFPS